jgi:MFS transporter, DHA2 family, multidrug resistance protein
MIATAPPPSPPAPERPPIPLVIAVVMTAVLEVLDITIVNVALPHMLGAFGATSDQITWVLTSYIVSAAVVMPLTGYLSTWLGRRRLLLGAIFGFVVASALCGMAWNLESMVIFRLAQGIFGAPLVPLSQAILLDAFPRERHERPAWHLGFTALGRLSAAKSHQRHQDRLGRHGSPRARRRRATICPGSGPDARLVQFPPHRGRHYRRGVRDCGFFLRGWNKADNIIDLTLLKDRNFVAGTLAITAYGISLFGWMALMPLFSQRLLGYPPSTAGTLFIPRAVVSTITLAITGSVLIRMFDARYLVAAGLVLTALGSMLMAHYPLMVDYWGIATPGIWSGIGTGLFFVPLTAAAFANIPRAQYDEASGVYALMRGIGGSAGIAVVSWLFVRQMQIHWSELSAHITPFKQALVPYLAEHGLTPYSPTAAPLVTYEIARQAQLLAFNDLFWFIGLVTLAIIPLLFFMTKPERFSLVPAH